MAIRTAVRYGNDNVYDYVQLTGDHSIYETSTPRPGTARPLWSCRCASATTSTFWR